MQKLEKLQQGKRQDFDITGFLLSHKIHIKHGQGKSEEYIALKPHMGI